MVELLPARVRVTHAEGHVLLESPAAMPPSARCVGDWLLSRARTSPDTPYLAEREGVAWARTTYAGALRAVEGIASALLARGARPERPVMILSDNSVASALLSLAAMHAGIPVAPVSPAYSLQSKTFGRLREVTAQLDPAFVYVEEEERFSAALRVVGSERTALLTAKAIREMSSTSPTPALERAFAAISPDTIAKVLFTSGSTGWPKGVVNTQRMLTANQESLATCWPFLAGQKPVVVDWLPWSHTFGGNHNFFLVLRNGGTLFIDRGRPVPGLVETSIANLADVSPTIWFNVPRGFDQAVALLETDPAASARVFANLEVVFYAAAALAPSTRTRLERVAASAGRPDIFFTSAWGSTETAPLATSAHFQTRTTGILGLPVPGVTLKLARTQDRFELRVRGANVTPGYWRAGGSTEPVPLDEQGFLATGDAGRLADEDRPEAGVVFVGRLSENFKLASGTWVSVAQVRLGIVDACAPLLLDAVIAGHDRESLGALLFLSPAALKLERGEARARIQAGLATYNQAHPGNSERIGRLLLVDTPPSLDEGETTDKGYTNQRRVIERRQSEIERMFSSNETLV